MPQEVPDENPLFLETTIQIDRVIGTQDRRNTIRLNVRVRTVCTSGHVLGEFNRTLIKDAVNFRNLLLMSPNVADAVKRLPNYIHSERKYNRTVDLLASLGFDDDKQNTLERLEDFIEFRAHDHFWDTIDRSCYIDEVGCILRSWQPELDENGRYNSDGLKCLKANPPPCMVLGFIQRHREVMEKFVTIAKQHNRNNVAKAAEAFDDILSSRDVPYGERSNCYPISDTLIVLEASNDAEIYSTDGDVHAICEILGKEVYSEKPLE